MQPYSRQSFFRLLTAALYCLILHAQSYADEIISINERGYQYVDIFKGLFPIPASYILHVRSVFSGFKAENR